MYVESTTVAEEPKRVDAAVAFAEEIASLKSLGFTNENELHRMLNKTNGDLEVVRNFLVARRKFREVKIQCAKSAKFAQTNEKKIAFQEMKLKFQGEKCKLNEEKIRIREMKKNLREEKLKLQEMKKTLQGEKKSIQESKRNIQGEKKCLQGEKMKLKEDKMKLKEEKMKNKGAHKAEKWEAKRANKLQKMEAKMAKRGNVEKMKNLNQTFKLGKDVQWGSTVSHLYIDGTKMISVVGFLQKLANVGRMRLAEKVVASMAKTFMEIYGIKDCTIVLDSSPLSIEEESFHVKSANPEFVSSNDALIHWAELKKSGSVFITPDAEVIQQLNAEGSIVCRPKQWLRALIRVLHGEEADDMKLGPWIKNWIATREDLTQEKNPSLNPTV